MLFKKVRYLFYIILLMIKSMVVFIIKHIKGEESADKYIRKAIYLWSEFTIKIIGINIEEKRMAELPEEPCLFVSNHESILDMPLLVYALRDRKIIFIGKKEILKIPVMGHWLKLSKSIPIDRENPRAAMKSIELAVERIKEGYSVIIFPEGTRSKNGKVNEFKKGSFKIATKSKATIVPVAIDGSVDAFEGPKDFTPANVKIVFEKPIYTKDMTKEIEKNLHVEVRDLIAAHHR